jgi:hypothetical protein
VGLGAARLLRRDRNQRTVVSGIRSAAEAAAFTAFTIDRVPSWAGSRGAEGVPNGLEIEPFGLMMAGALIGAAGLAIDAMLGSLRILNE